MSFHDLSSSMQARRFMGETNPVLVSARSGELAVAHAAIREYSSLILAITLALEMGVTHAQVMGWDSIAHELERNIAEERGSRTRGIPHCIIIHHHCVQLGLPWPGAPLPALEGYDTTQEAPVLKNLSAYAPATQSFIRELLRFTRHASSSAVIGAILALETTAGPELEFVAGILNEILVATNLDPIPQEAVSCAGQQSVRQFDPFSLPGFFAHHIGVWEEGHQAGLEWVIHQTSTLNREELTHGFVHVLDLMDAWWEGLAAS